MSTPGAAPARAFALGPDGWIAGVRRVASPNFDARPALPVELLVIHCISLPPGCLDAAQVERLFTNCLDPGAHPYFARVAQARVSAHFLIDRAGALTQFVSCADRAWHAGDSQWEGRPRCNDYSIGVELVGSEFEPYRAAQYACLQGLQAALCAAFPIRAVRGHSEIAPGRKTDPGPLFDWDRIARDPRRD